MNRVSRIDKMQTTRKMKYKTISSIDSTGVKQLEPTFSDEADTKGKIQYFEKMTRITEGGQNLTSNIKCYTAQSLSPNDQIKYDGGSQWYRILSILTRPERQGSLYTYLVNEV
jgi:hypothetical protein